MILRFCFLVLLGCGAVVSMAQDQTLFFVNPYSFNPSYAGIEGRPALFLSYRRQWTSIEGSPQIANLSLHLPGQKFLSFGASLNNDQRGIFKTTTGMVSTAYTLMLGDYKSMRFGVSAGLGSTSLDLTGIDGDTDPALLTGNNMYMQGSAGVSFHIKTFHGGIALPSLFQPKYLTGGGADFSPLGQLMVHASNRFYFDRNKHVLEPHVVFRYYDAQPSQLEAALVYHMNNILWLGGSYKQNFGNAAFLGFHFNKALGLGYAYTFKNASASQIQSPTHEVQLTLLLGAKRKDIPFYSFVDTDKEKKVHHHKPTHVSASQAIAQNRATAKPSNTAPVAKETAKPPVKTPQSQPQQKQPTAPAKQPASQQTNPPVKPAQTQPTQAQQSPTKQPEKPAPANPVATVDPKSLGEMPHVHDTLHPAHEEEKEKISRLAVHAEDPDEHHEGDVDDHPHYERHEFVKRGNHSEELEIGDYVIAGVFRSKVNAEHFADGLKMHGFPADHGHLTLKNLWYVYLAATTDLEAAKKERDKFRKMKIFRDAWLLTVHH